MLLGIDEYQTLTYKGQRNRPQHLDLLPILKYIFIFLRLILGLKINQKSFPHQMQS